jgi:hypothetical protein
MLAPVQLDGHARLRADEVENIGTKRALAAELETVEAASAKVIPEMLFGVGGVLSKAAGEAIHKLDS